MRDGAAAAVTAGADGGDAVARRGSATVLGGTKGAPRGEVEVGASVGRITGPGQPGRRGRSPLTRWPQVALVRTPGAATAMVRRVEMLAVGTAPAQIAGQPVERPLPGDRRRPTRWPGRAVLERLPGTSRASSPAASRSRDRHRAGPQHPPTLEGPGARSRQVRYRGFLPCPGPGATERVLALHQQLINVDRQREQVARRLPVRAGPVRTAKLGRDELGAADSAEIGGTVGRRELHRVAVDEGHSSLRGRYQDVALVEVADDPARGMQHVGGTRPGSTPPTPGIAS